MNRRDRCDKRDEHGHRCSGPLATRHPHRAFGHGFNRTSDSEARSARQGRASLASPRGRVASVVSPPGGAGGPESVPGEIAAGPATN